MPALTLKRSLRVALAAGLALACRSETTPAIKLRLTGPQLDLQFQPKTALAEYIELPDDHNELRITLASYPTSCEEFISPPDDGALLTIVISVPPDTEPDARSYPYLSRTRSAANAPEPPLEPSSVPRLRTHKQSHEIPAGGSIQLTRISLERGAVITGSLGYEFAGDQDQGASSISGQFSAEVCRSSRAHLRSSQ
jgi:hypothetical protein